MRLKCPSIRTYHRLLRSLWYIHTYIRLSIHKKFLWFQWNLACRSMSMSDARWHAVWPDPRSRSRAPSKLQIRLFSKAISTAIYNESWQLTTWFLNYGTISKFDRAGFFIFVLVFVSRNFNGRNVSCEEPTVLHVTNLFIILVANFKNKFRIIGLSCVGIFLIYVCVIAVVSWNWRTSALLGSTSRMTRSGLTPTKW